MPAGGLTFLTVWRRKLKSSGDLSIVIKTVYAATIAQWKSDGFLRAFKSFTRLILNPARFSDAIGVVSDPKVVPLVTHYPGLIYKWRNKYLDNSFAKSQRSGLLAFHYRYVGNVVGSSFYSRLLTEGFVLWEYVSGSGSVAITLRFPKFHREGELSLVLERNGARLYELSFAVIQGSAVGLDTPQVMFVARIQGHKNKFARIKETTKICKDIAPPYLLMAAAEGIAVALDVGFVAGCNTANQVSSRKSFNYESFWDTLLAQKTSGDFYISPIPLSSRPLEQCSPDHRRRTRNKRKFKAAISEAVQNAFVHQCLRDSRQRKVLTWVAAAPMPLAVGRPSSESGDADSVSA